MSNTTVDPRTAGGRHLVLIVDDELINREILKLILEDDYDTMTAPDGERALELIRENSARLSLILLDLLMPGLHGLEVLRILQDDPALKHIPVIVLTTDQKAEVESLRAGAADFLSKPYPEREVILARVGRTIEMTEDRAIIAVTERDELTGLLNRDYFYRYARQFDRRHAEQTMDAILLDVCHFRMVNERYGKAYGDQVLRRIGESLRAAVQEEGGIACRRNADTFLVYRPHRENYQGILDRVSESVSYHENGNRIRLRMGVYANADREIDMERRFDRAKMAADTVHSGYRSTFAFYDNALHENEMFAERLLDSFDAAIREKQFKVFFQPKFDVRPDTPVLSSAEALVRWIHPELGFVNPGQFIPLFENNGLIRRLDEYVWRETAERIRDWKERLGFSIPVSVNVSRVDMYDPELIATLLSLTRENGLTPDDLLLEITESAYTSESAQIIEKVNQLRELGFRIEMDDFGSGYSSLNMISELPIDALKLDMVFIRNAFAKNGNTRLIEIIIDIADYLAVPVIAEGVETEEQMNTLRAMGCDLVQGYYFSRPVPPEEFESFILEKRRRLAEEGEEAVYFGNLEPGTRRARTGEGKPAAGPMPRLPDRKGTDANSAAISIAQALSSNFESVYYVDAFSDDYTEFAAQGNYEELQIQLSGTDFFAKCRKNIPQVVYPEDQKKLLDFIDKEVILQILTGQPAVSVEYRLMIEGTPTWYRLKVVKAADKRHLVIGLSNVEAEILREKALEATRAANVTFSSIAKALAADYFSIYYVDTETDQFIEYSAHDDYEVLGIEKSGEDFFNLSRTNIARVVHPEDRDRILQDFTKEKLLSELEQSGTFTRNYRLMVGDKVNYVSMKATRMADSSDHHIVIGINNINAQIQRQLDYDAARALSDTYSRIALALSRDYFSIYMVNTVTDEYVEYSSGREHQQLHVERNGEDFFRECRRSVLRQVYKEDLERALAVWDKPQLMQQLESGRVLSSSYRLMMNEEPVYINCKIIRMGDDLDNKYIVIGVSNVDEQMRREQELTAIREKANKDALTGTKSKHAYVDVVSELNTRIDMGTAQPFAVVVCDVNGLKTVNDTQGHAAGDKLICEASHIICNIFKHSPVFRVGGDEFVSILSGGDYNQRAALMNLMTESNRRSAREDGVIIACGVSEWDPRRDNRFEAVFDRADAAMYENKSELKILRG